MKMHNNTYCTDEVLIKGYVCYEDREPVKGAIVILQELFSRDRSCEFNKDEEAVYSTYTTTNCHGEFCLFICDKSKYYKIKVFDNQYNCRYYRNCNINIDLE